jgi:hypothetical protein
LDAIALARVDRCGAFVLINRGVKPRARAERQAVIKESTRQPQLGRHAIATCGKAVTLMQIADCRIDILREAATVLDSLGPLRL